MNVRLKPLEEQVIVITGASSGIGLVTARMAARRGARLVLAARNEGALEQLRQEIREMGTDVECVTADVGRYEDVQRIAERAGDRFGGFDTWVNNAGVSVYGRIMDVDLEDMRRVIDTDFWGMVYGARVAVDLLRRRGGALINIGSVVSDRAIPMQGIYSAAKHAVKGFTDTLRMEVEKDGWPVAVTLIKPGSIDTPFTHHAKNYMEVEPDFPPPVYAPELVAEAILHAAETPTRDLFVGGGAKMIETMGKYAPRTADRYMEATMFAQQRGDKPMTRPREGALYEPATNGLEERGGYSGHVFEYSPYTKAAMHPMLTAVVALGAGLAITAFWRASVREAGRPEPGAGF